MKRPHSSRLCSPIAGRVVVPSLSGSGAIVVFQSGNLFHINPVLRESRLYTHHTLYWRTVRACLPVKQLTLGTQRAHRGLTVSSTTVTGARDREIGPMLSFRNLHDKPVISGSLLCQEPPHTHTRAHACTHTHTHAHTRTHTHTHTHTENSLLYQPIDSRDTHCQSGFHVRPFEAAHKQTRLSYLERGQEIFFYPFVNIFYGYLCDGFVQHLLSFFITMECVHCAFKNL